MDRAERFKDSFCWVNLVIFLSLVNNGKDFAMLCNSRVTKQEESRGITQFSCRLGGIGGQRNYLQNQFVNCLHSNFSQMLSNIKNHREKT